MRCTQVVGLSGGALLFLKDYATEADICHHCNRPYPRRLESIGSYYGMPGEVFPLYRHYLKDGCSADEFLQTTQWHSGLMLFLGLKVSDGQAFLWDNEDISSRLGCNISEQDAQGNVLII